MNGKCEIRIFNWNTSVTGHKQGTVAFPSANNYEGQILTPRSISAQVTNIMQQTRS